MRQVELKDFDQIAELYADYIDYKLQHIEMGYVGKKLSADELRDIYAGIKKGDDAVLVKNPAPPKIGWVADDEKGKIIAYYQWAYRDDEAMCEFSLWPDGDEKANEIAEKLLVYCFDALKKMGIKKAVGAVSDRMRTNKKYAFFEKYVTNKVEYPDTNHSYERTL